MISAMHIYLLKQLTIANTAAADADASNINKKVIFKNCAPFTSCRSRINNTQIDFAQYIVAVMPMYNVLFNRIEW